VQFGTVPDTTSSTKCAAEDDSMTRVFSGIQPTGDFHLGNYLGALRHWTVDQHEHDSLFCVVDLHAITTQQDPADLHQKTLEAAAALMAVGLDPAVCTVFVQSQVHQHAELAWLVECTAGFGELSRMTQFKDKSARGAETHVSAGLFTYPALMAADILLYDTDRVPVGEDQRQHLELTRDVAERFNSRYGETFVVPAAAISKVGARIMDLQDPMSKMSKSSASLAGCVLIFEEPTSIMKKFKRAVTDSDTDVTYDPKNKPGVSNLLAILAAATEQTPEDVAAGYERYGDLKVATGEAVVELLTPIQQRRAELMSDRAELARLIEVGAGKAQAMAAPVLSRARAAMGFVARP
jgi:tryptophanyl-tRNA synthetase